MFIDVLIRKVKRENVPFSRPCPLGDKNAPHLPPPLVDLWDFTGVKSLILKLGLTNITAEKEKSTIIFLDKYR